MLYFLITLCNLYATAVGTPDSIYVGAKDPFNAVAVFEDSPIDAVNNWQVVAGVIMIPARTIKHTAAPTVPIMKIVR